MLHEELAHLALSAPALLHVHLLSVFEELATRESKSADANAKSARVGEVVSAYRDDVHSREKEWERERGRERERMMCVADDPAITLKVGIA